MPQPPKLVSIASAAKWPNVDQRAPFELPSDVLPAQVPFVHAVVDWLDMPVAYIDSARHLRFANAAFADTLKQARHQLIEASVLSDVAEHWNAAARPALATALSGQAALAARLIDDASTTTAADEIESLLGAGAVFRFVPQTDALGAVQGCLIIRGPLGSESPPHQYDMTTLVHALPNPAAIIDEQLRFVFANQAALDERHWLLDDIKGRTLESVLGPTTWQEIAPHIERALNGERVDYERKSMLFGAEPRWITRTLIPRRGADGRIDGLYIFGHDIHALRSEQEQLAAQKNEVRAFIDALPLPVAFLDVSRRFAYANSAYYRSVGKTETELIGAEPNDVMRSDLFSLVAPYFARAFEGQTIEYEHLAVDHSGEERWRRVRLVPRRGAASEIEGVFLISADVHEERMARATLEKRERQVRLFSDNIPQPLAYLDADRRFGFVNKAFARQFDLVQDRIVGESFRTGVGTRIAELLEPHLNRVMNGESLTEERLLPLPSGEPRWIELRWLADVDTVTQHGLAIVRGAYLFTLDVHEARKVRAAYEDSIAELQKAMNSIGTPIAFVDNQEIFRFANASMLAWRGLAFTELVGRSTREVIGERLYEKSKPYIRRALAGDEMSFEREFVFPDQSERWTRVRYVPQRDDSGTVTGFYVVVFDVHDLKSQQRELQLKQAELRRANWLLSSHLENSPLAALELDADLIVRRWSARAERLFGWSREQVLNRSIWDLNLIANDEIDAITRSFAQVMSSYQQRVSVLQRVKHRDGASIWCEWYISALADESGEVASIFALVQDVNQRVEAEAQLQHLATYDALTGLPNRSSLQTELSQALERAERAGSTVAALFIDLDHFKNVNDTLGHRVGDQLLLVVARILKSCVRKGDVVSRMGGDEFMVVVEHPKARFAAQHIANKVLIALNQPIPVEGHMLTIAGSVGIAVYPEHGADANTLLKNADVAMYHAKELGKGRFEFYSEELAREREEQALIESSLRVAMARDQLTLCFQPRVSLRDGSIEGAEALLRWKHPELGDVPPKKFIRVAEETGLIFELGTWVFRRACTQLREWELKGLALKTISVNFSARQLLMRDLVDRISNILSQTGCDPRRIEVEITETSMLFDVATTKRVITSLKRLGLRIAIDDFGTGFSSLSHLQQLDLDALKVDQSFIRDLLYDSGDAAIVRAVVSLGRGIGLTVIAEGVENGQQLAFLKECGCDLYQGFHFSPAISGRAFEELIRMHRQVQRPAAGY